MENSSAFKDPVCGMAVTEKSFHQLQQDGRTYYFCGAKCKARFATPAQPLWGRWMRHFLRTDRKTLQGTGPK